MNAPEWETPERRAKRREAQLARCPGMKLQEETHAQAAARRNAMYRAGGDCRCTCGHEYWQHPEDEVYDFLHVLCTGDRVKL